MVKKYLSRKDICEFMGISLAGLHRLMKKGLPYLKIGRRTVFKQEDVEKWIENKED